MKPRCVCIGNMTIDDLVFHTGRTRMGVLGGDGVYASVGAAFWDVDVWMSAVAGPDYPLSQLRESFRFDVSAVVHKEESSLRNWGLYEEDGSRQFIFRGAKDHWFRYTPSPEDISAELLKGAYVHMAPAPWECQISLLRHARSSGAAFIAVDPPYHFLEGITEGELGRLLEHADAFLPSRQEAELIYPGLKPEEALVRLADVFPNLRIIIIKLGELGAIGFDRTKGTTLSVPAYPAHVVDPTGAGDSFCGGFLAGYAVTGDLREAALCGGVSASFVVETEGTLSLSNVSSQMAQERLAKLVAG